MDIKKSGTTSFLIGAAIAYATIWCTGPVMGPILIISASLAAKKMADLWINKYKDDIRNWIDKKYAEGTKIHKVLVRVHGWINNGAACILQILGESEPGVFRPISEHKVPKEEAEKMNFKNQGDTSVWSADAILQM